MELKKSQFNYQLPQELIAQTPITPRDASRLMVLNKKEHTIEHKHFSDLLDYLNKDDLLVLNNSKVMPARLVCFKEDGTELMEFLLLREHEKDIWEVMVKPGKRAKMGCSFSFNNKLVGKIIEILENGNRLVRFSYSGNFFDVLDSVGKMPLPHYIKTELKDAGRYQTVYSKYLGSAAAPTAGLHFTKELLKRVEEKGVKIGFVTLHVGAGTFRPVKTENIIDHRMHEEYFELPEVTANLINQTKQTGGRIIAVGTTSCRSLESVYNLCGEIKSYSGQTKLFIYPGAKFNVIDALLTNFHLPESTLIMLVAAFCGLDFTMQAYNLAVRNKYRFYSFGDAMFIY
ncbi:MAG: tRNA preQ1(34) S-adenosylmethionine ribosyltransferase-isomerase QueA [Oscillospiraceae bacterium]|nr:tRNA preQ1(34) S-adenosylmethionine ribosyltransferase-isomerase QueA [Oscillospiraceae bacterium]